MIQPKSHPILTRLETDLKLRGLSVNTQRGYLRYVEQFLKHCNKPIKEITEIDARDFLIFKMHENKVSEGTINLANAAIRFFFAVTLNITVNYLQFPRFKKRKTLPVLLSREDIHFILNLCPNVKHNAFFYLAYGSGLRVSEIASLRVIDIDSKAMRVFVKAGKGKKDRYTILSNDCLSVLREYWMIYKPKNPSGWLFPGVDKNNHISSEAIAHAFDKWVGLIPEGKPASIHSLRHAFATHLLEDGASIFQIKELLGHASLSSTTVYLHLANNSKGLTSPADRVYLNA
jgi:site-specific recombinase XerD